MGFVRGKLPTAKEVVEAAQALGCKKTTYEMNVTGPYGELKKVTALINPENQDYMMWHYEDNEKLTFSVIENVERSLRIKLIESAEVLDFKTKQ